MNEIHPRRRFSGGRQRLHPTRLSDYSRAGCSTLTLLDVPLGCHAKIGMPSAAGSTAGTQANTRLQGFDQLQALGLASGYWVRVLQRTPVIVLQIDHLELAMEKELAARVVVEEIVPRLWSLKR